MLSTNHSIGNHVACAAVHDEGGLVQDPRVSVLTGGVGGIAMATARRLADRGPLLLADVSDDALAAAADTLRGEGADVHTARCDVSDQASVDQLAQQAAALGPLGALVHTAGLAPPAAKDPRRVLDVNLAGTVRILDAFLPLATAGTVAVCIASLAGHRAFTAEYDELLSDPLDPELYDRLQAAGGTRDDVLATYSLSKHGVMVECRRRAAAWGRQGARLVSLSPGLVADTSIGEAAATIHAGAYAQQSAVGRPGYAADMAGVVAYITGCDILVDGGVVAHTLHHADASARESWNAATYAATGD
jgi:NAD(P)-dependent dehydrogenase (short-subunit alcohol dehydrogenase family)